MKHQRKLLKSIKHLFCVVLLSSIAFSCTKDNSYGMLYYFEQQNMTTTVPITCDKINNYKGLRKVTLNDKEIYELLILSKKDLIPSESNTIDVRYKIEINSDVFCLGYSGSFILNDEYKGEVDFINIIENYISDTKEQSIEVTEPTPKPWDNI